MKRTLLTLLSVFCITFSINAQTTFGPKQLINGTGDAPFTITSGLVDGDAFIDIIAGTNTGNTIEVYINNGDGTFDDTPILVTNTLSAIGGLKLVDLNNDSSLDLLASAYTNDKLVWYANDGSGNFGAEQTISSSVMGASGIATGTIDAGTTVDVAVTAYDSGQVVWFSNNGSGTFTGPNTIDNTISAPGSVNLKDINGDMFLDALITNAQFTGPNDIAQIFLNDGSGNFTAGDIVSTGKDYIFNASFEDLDGDANLDILLTEITNTPGAGNFYWIESDGVGGYTETAITTTIGNPSVAQHHDLDDDGLKDIVLSSGTSGAGNDIVWFRNLGGTYGAEQVIDATQSQAYVYTVADFDNDNDLDIASCAFNQDQLNWFENLKYTLSNDSFQSEAIGFYPNPAKDKLYFRSNNLETISVSVFDVLGKQVLAKELAIDRSLNVSELKSGMYIIKFKGINSSYKFVKN